MCELDEMKTKLNQPLPEKPPDSKDEKHIQVIIKQHMWSVYILHCKYYLFQHYCNRRTELMYLSLVRKPNYNIYTDICYMIAEHEH